MTDVGKENFRRVIHSPDGLRAIAKFGAAAVLRLSVRNEPGLAEFLDELKPPRGGDGVRSFDAIIVRRAEEFEAEGKILLERAAEGGDGT